MDNTKQSTPAEQKHIVIIGASGHARVIADIIRCSGDFVEGFIDDRDVSEFPGMNILGKVADAEAIHRVHPEYSFIVGIGQCKTREQIVLTYPDLPYCTVNHPSAVIAKDCSIGLGTVVMANVVVNTGTVVGAHSIINTAATVDHDCRIEDFVHIGPGVHVSGTVGIGRCSWVGVGASVVNNVNICGSCVVGAGAVVIESIEEPGTYVGVPAVKIRG